MRRLARVAGWLAARILGPRVHPEFVHAADRAALYRITRSSLGPCIPVDASQQARFAAIKEATPGELRDVCEELWRLPEVQR